MPWPRTARKPWKRAATITTPNRSNCHGCSARSRPGCPEPVPNLYRHSGSRMSQAVERPRQITLKDESLSEVRHNLRTPINHILGYGEMLLEDAADHGQEHLLADLRQMLDDGKLALAIINGALTPATNEVHEPELMAMREAL